MESTISLKHAKDWGASTLNMLAAHETIPQELQTIYESINKDDEFDGAVNKTISRLSSNIYTWYHLVYFWSAANLLPVRYLQPTNVNPHDLAMVHLILDVSNYLEPQNTQPPLEHAEQTREQLETQVTAPQFPTSPPKTPQKTTTAPQKMLATTQTPLTPQVNASQSPPPPVQPSPSKSPPSPPQQAESDIPHNVHNSLNDLHPLSPNQQEMILRLFPQGATPEQLHIFQLLAQPSSGNSTTNSTTISSTTATTDATGSTTNSTKASVHLCPVELG